VIVYSKTNVILRDTVQWNTGLVVTESQKYILFSCSNSNKYKLLHFTLTKERSFIVICGSMKKL